MQPECAGWSAAASGSSIRRQSWLRPPATTRCATEESRLMYGQDGCGNVTINNAVTLNGAPGTPVIAWRRHSNSDDLRHEAAHYLDISSTGKTTEPPSWPRSPLSFNLTFPGDPFKKSDDYYQSYCAPSRLPAKKLPVPTVSGPGDTTGTAGSGLNLRHT